MSKNPSADIDELHERLRRLESENAQLRSAAGEPQDRSAAAPGRWRAFVSALCIVIASILVPVAIVGAWARLQLVDEDAFVATLAPIASDPAVQSMVVDETMEAIGAQVDFGELTSNVFDGIASIEGMPPAAVSALGLLEQPAAQGLENLVQTTVTRVVESDAFVDVWATATRGAHRAVTAAATYDNQGAVVITDEGLGIQLGVIVDQVKQRLTERGIGIASLIPAVDRVVIIGTGSALVAIQTIYTIATLVGLWLPFLCLALFLAGILVARRRTTAVLGSGIGLAVGAGALALTFSIASAVVAQAAVSLAVSPTALDVVYRQLVDAMAHTAAVGFVIGLGIAVLAWAQGRWKAARAVRAGVGSINAGLRRALVWRGIDTGAFGTWMYERRAVARGILVALVVLWLLLLRPLGFGEVVLVTVVALFVWWLMELAQRRPGEAIGVSTDAAAQAAEAAHAEAYGTAEPTVAADVPAAVVAAQAADAAPAPSDEPEPAASAPRSEG
ncbi:hypothetical protein ACFQRL_12990 [Microbacterium fluvii]|uniref:Integral membrane protein n=1 Tax=Microbacterium fluvii TaxID=415215 RepID=A0ABW2HFF9_9MICO|nr:hypothetical protein [Microbacterium fluvii]MCU4673511.1 hypothetical protein [Microbacterium fluvii]